MARQYSYRVIQTHTIIRMSLVRTTSLSFDDFRQLMSALRVRLWMRRDAPLVHKGGGQTVGRVLSQPGLDVLLVHKGGGWPVGCGVSDCGQGVILARA